MKNSIFVLLFAAIVSNNAFSQARLGFKIDQVAKEFSEQEYPIRNIGKNNGEGYHFYVKLNVGDVAYYSNEDSVITKTVVRPKNNESLEYLKGQYSSYANKINDKSWLICYDEDQEATIINIIDDKDDNLYKLIGTYVKITSTQY
jgi:hypothetical protein